MSELLVLARADPTETLRQGRLIVDSGDATPLETSVAYRAMGIAARQGETIEAAIRYGELSVTHAEESGIPDARAGAKGSLAGSLDIAGQGERGLALVFEASQEATGLLRAQLTYQRGAILENQGHTDQALVAYEEALPIFLELENEEFQALTHRNLGTLETKRGDLESAERHLMAARDINSRLGLDAEIAGIDINLGTLNYFKGDLPEALGRYSAGDAAYMAMRGDTTPQHVGRSEVLISAGLYGEALDLATEIAEKNETLRDTRHAAIAYLVAARAAVLARRFGEAEELVAAVEKLFVGLEPEPWLLEVRLISLLARYQTEGPSAGVANSALELAPTLDSARSFASGAEARLLAGRTFIDIGDGSKGRRVLASVASMDAGPIETRLQAVLARAMIARSLGDRRRASRAARSGLQMLQDYQSSLAASDLRAGIERWGADLGRIGLAFALQAKAPRRVFTWMEGTRARALSHPVVVPTQSDDDNKDLASLRRIDAEMRAGKDDPTLLEERTRIQEAIKVRDRMRRGGPGSPSSLSPTELLVRLGASELVELGFSDGQVWVIHVKNGRFNLREAGSRDEVERELKHLRFQMRRAARRRRTGPSTSVHELDRLLFGGLKLSADSVVVVPPPELMATPWSSLPTLEGVDLTVAPSAEVWLRSLDKGRQEGTVVVAAGPDLDLAEAELGTVASIHDDPVILSVGDAKVDDTAEALAEARLAHIACHASFQADSPMFSSLRLADGNLNVYDIERLGHVPSIVILSACDSGFTDTRPGEELTGLTAALLRMGTKTVVASVGLVPDSEATRQLMVALHEALVEGHGPARALRIAREAVAEVPGGDIAAASFLCIGAG